MSLKSYRESVVIIEDKEFSGLLKKELEDWNYNVSLYNEYPEKKEQKKHKHTDLVLIDIKFIEQHTMMHRMNWCCYWLYIDTENRQDEEALRHRKQFWNMFFRPFTTEREKFYELLAKIHQIHNPFRDEKYIKAGWRQLSSVSERKLGDVSERS